MHGLYRALGEPQPVRAEASVGAHDLRIVLEDGTSRALPLAGAEVELGGFQGGYVVCTWRRAGAEEAVYLPRAGLAGELRAQSASPEFTDRVAALTAGARRRWAASRLIGLVVVAAVIASAVAFLARARDLAVAAVPPSWEVAAGDAFFASMEGQLDRDVDPVVDAFVQRVGQRLLEAHGETPYPFTFHVVRDPVPNAFAFPGGNVVVHTGLVALAERPEEVAGVIGHELAHVLRRHSLQAAVEKLGLAAGVSLALGDVSGLVELEALTMVQNAFSRDHEEEADEVGLALLHQAEIDPAGLPAFFDRLGESAGLELPAILSTHPTSAARSARLAKLAAALPQRDYAPLDVDWERIKAAVGSP